mmetsp:Transcript_87232/g.236412  ORF Transcript_87232/g.236412 Transcript_87232/m.236412 type:complete len:390 (+) Transcript_87232:303-1472(+)
MVGSGGVRGGGHAVLADGRGLWPLRRRDARVGAGGPDEPLQRLSEAALLRDLPQREPLPPRRSVCLCAQPRGGERSAADPRRGDVRARSSDVGVLHRSLQGVLVPDRRPARLALLHVRPHLSGRPQTSFNWLRAPAVPVLEQEGYEPALLAALPARPALPVRARRQGAAVPPGLLPHPRVQGPAAQEVPPRPAVRLLPQAVGRARLGRGLPRGLQQAAGQEPVPRRLVPLLHEPAPLPGRLRRAGGHAIRRLFGHGSAQGRRAAGEHRDAPHARALGRQPGRLRGGRLGPQQRPENRRGQWAWPRCRPRLPASHGLLGRLRRGPRRLGRPAHRRRARQQLPGVRRHGLPHSGLGPQLPDVRARARAVSSLGMGPGGAHGREGLCVHTVV